MNTITKQQLNKIKLILTDVDGVLTDGFLYISDNYSEPFSRFNIYDGLAVHLAKEAGIMTGIISGRKSKVTEARSIKLGIDLVYTGINNKKACLDKILQEYNLDYSEVAFIGDDLIDLPVLTRVGFPCAPNNAIIEVKERVAYVSNINGGKGVFRDIVELIIKAQDKYQAIINQYLN